MGSTGNYTGACATFQYNLKLGISMIQSGESLISFVGAAESGIVPEIYEAFAQHEVSLKIKILLSFKKN